MTPPHATTADGRALRGRPAPRIPRRVSGAGRVAPPPGVSRPRRTADPLYLRCARRGRGVADSRFLDRLVRGRLWVPVIAVALIGIVFLQVSMLSLNAGIGRSVEAAQALSRQNQTMRADVSRMESGERILGVAEHLGMVVPTAGGFHYLEAGAPGAAERAANSITAPTAEALARTTATGTTTGATATTATATTTASTTTTGTPATTGAATTASAEQPPAATGTPLEPEGQG